MTDLALVICTFRRERLLAKALGSVAGQACPEGLAFSVIVVDNSDEGSAQAVVEAAVNGFPFPLRWIAAHPANISVARNAGTMASEAEYLAFLDDDQELCSGWLAAVGEALRNPSFDAYFGAVDPVFETPERTTAIVRQLFSRRLDAPSGQELFAMGPEKTRDIALATNNSIFRRQAVLQDGAPFDLAFGNGGGEDYDLLCRMQRRGSRFGWLPGACAREFVPASRCDARYLCRRFYAGGQAYAAAISNSSANPGIARWWLRLKALVQGAVLLPRLPLRLISGGEGLKDYTYVWAGVLGKLSFGGIHPIYRSHDGPPRTGN